MFRMGIGRRGHADFRSIATRCGALRRRAGGKGNMTRFRPTPGLRAIALRTWVATLLGGVLSAPPLQASPSYDDGAGNGCVSCHNGFQGGNGPLHTQHRVNFGVTTCNLCHPSGGGTTPVLTYFSGSGGGFGCAGCHGQDYGETSPNSGMPKATAYGLREFHVVQQGIVACGTGSCHAPGSNGHGNPFPPLFGENEVPPYFDPAYSNLLDPCASDQEDLFFDLDSLGLDNDGDGSADYPLDSDCPQPPTPTPTASPTPTVPFNCAATPVSGCIAPAKAVLLVNEKKPGKEKLKIVLKKLLPAVAPSQFGDPVGGSTAYKVCIYNGANAFSGEYTVARAGDTCGTQPCWSSVTGKGYKYKDAGTTTDGILKINALGGAASKGKVLVLGKNKTATLPLGVAAALQNQTSATVQVLTSDAACFGATLTQVKKADGTLFKALGP